MAMGDEHSIEVRQELDRCARRLTDPPQPGRIVATDVVQTTIVRSPQTLDSRYGNEDPPTWSRHRDERLQGRGILLDVLEHVERNHQIEGRRFEWDPERKFPIVDRPVRVLCHGQVARLIVRLERRDQSSLAQQIEVPTGPAAGLEDRPS